MGRDALAIEGSPGPTPAQNALKPPPVPVDSTIGVPKEVVAPNRSAMVRDNGDYQMHHMFFLGLIIGGGTAQIQKNIIAERGLDMPREPKLAKA